MEVEEIRWGSMSRERVLAGMTGSGHFRGKVKTQGNGNSQESTGMTRGKTASMGDIEPDLILHNQTSV